jgi:hypothetical protein
VVWNRQNLSDANVVRIVTAGGDSPEQVKKTALCPSTFSSQPPDHAAHCQTDRLRGVVHAGSRALAGTVNCRHFYSPASLIDAGLNAPPNSSPQLPFRSSIIDCTGLPNHLAAASKYQVQSNKHRCDRQTSKETDTIFDPTLPFGGHSFSVQQVTTLKVILSH